MPLIANCNHMQTCELLATVACGNTGLRSGIEANLHAVRAIWPQSAGWSVLTDDPRDDNGNIGPTISDFVTSDPRINRDLAEDHADSRYTPDSGFGTALFDAKNAFQELNRYLMLWNVAHLWNTEVALPSTGINTGGYASYVMLRGSLCG